MKLEDDPQTAFVSWRTDDGVLDRIHSITNTSKTYNTTDKDTEPKTNIWICALITSGL